MPEVDLWHVKLNPIDKRREKKSPEEEENRKQFAICIIILIKYGNIHRFLTQTSLYMYYTYWTIGTRIVILTFFLHFLG